MTRVLQPTCGEIVAHVHENALTGLAQNLFWNISVDFKPISCEGETWQPSLSVDWLTWHLSSWRDLDGCDLGSVLLPEMVECSVYLLGEHHWADLRRMTIRANDINCFEIDISGTAEVCIDDQLEVLVFSFQCNLSFNGLIVVPDNLHPKPKTSDEVRGVIGKFIGLNDLTEPSWDRFRYVLQPQS